MEQGFIKVILTKYQRKSEGDKKRMWIGKSGCIELNKTHYCTEKFNVAHSLYGVLGVALYFSKGFSEAAARGSVVAEILQPLEVTVVYFLEQESNLWFPAL